MQLQNCKWQLAAIPSLWLSSTIVIAMGIPTETSLRHYQLLGLILILITVEVTVFFKMGHCHKFIYIHGCKSTYLVDYCKLFGECIQYIHMLSSRTGLYCATSFMKHLKKLHNVIDLVVRKLSQLHLLPSVWGYRRIFHVAESLRPYN